jgi:hypothetical protein
VGGFVLTAYSEVIHLMALFQKRRLERNLLWPRVERRGVRHLFFLGAIELADGIRLHMLGINECFFTLEIQLQRKLHNSRIACADDLPKTARLPGKTD